MSIVGAISKRELLAYQADVKGSIFRQIRERFSRLKERGFTQKEWANNIDMDEGQLSRRIRGDYDLQLETFSDLARGLGCRINVQLVPLTASRIVTEYVAPQSGKPPFEDGQAGKQKPPETSPIDNSGVETVS